MNSLNLNKPRPVEKSMLPALEKLLGYEIRLADNYFETNKSINFYDFLSDILDESNHRVVSIDWRWVPEDLFWSLSQAFPQHGFILKSSKKREANDVFEGFEVTYLFDEKLQSVYIQFDDLSDFINGLNKQLIEQDNLQLVDFTSGDTYEFLVVGSGFDTEKFVSFVDEEPYHLMIEKEAPPKPKTTSKTIQDKEIFYNPSIGWIDEADKLHILEYYWNNEWDFDLFTSRVYAGGDIHTALQADLQQDFNYTDDFEILEVRYFDDYGYEDEPAKPRFRVDVQLSNKIETKGIAPLGMKIRLAATS